ncbi:FAD-binding oxidoreductase [Rubrivirga sp. S365]|uniref:FAD-binding oxidoreductase n=1 Tax=Rubrivirga litoralis TaxID=3075598 RepID=A0ABU3BQZ5_9BACT|nr:MULTISPECIES: FAD-binding oxidoreductase [unclassified Rubrivirga]MDT0631706.1 FAD-binding oxidoreductase [Rubrivirga sp. F394]MDT7855550.1 FAD-binding oxidoreductase [Rubrivirga sp. S365]
MPAPHPAPPPGYLPARVERRLDVADDLAVIWLRPSEPVTFLPGQYLTLAAPGADGGVVKRPYSVVSAPHEPLVELVVELVPEGTLTPLLWPLGPGDGVWVRRRAAGRFLLDPERSRHVMACTVTGVAPFLSMIRAHVAVGGAADDRFLVVWGASHAAEFGPYLEELDALAARDDVEAVPTVSRPWENPAWDGEVGRVEDVLRKHLDRLGWAAADVAGYACGHPQMVETVQGLLRRAGVAEDHVHEEVFFTEGGAEDDPPAPSGTLPPEPPRPSRPPGAPGGVVLKTVPRP